MPRNYTLLLHETVRSHLVSLDVRARQRLREKLEFLQAGLWDAGVRVKKLKGSGRAVFEARLSRGDRILFTLGTAPDGAAPAATGAGAGETRIYVWGVVKHDDVNAAAERRIVPANAPFLDFEPAQVEELPELVADDLGGDYFSPALDQPVAVAAAGSAAAAGEPLGDPPGDAGPQRWLVVDDEEWRRLLAAHRGDQLELFLFLTREQARLLHSEPPLLLSGTAGSGKTTIAVYFLLRDRVRRLAPAPEAGAVPAGPGPRPRPVATGPGVRGGSAFGYRARGGGAVSRPAGSPADPGEPGNRARGMPAPAPPLDPTRRGAHRQAAAGAAAGSPAAPAQRSPIAAPARRDAAHEAPAAGANATPAGAERALFLTCSGHLKRFSERIYRGLVKATEQEDVPAAVRFATLGELLREILGHAGRPEWQAPPAGLAEFGAIIRNHPGAARYDTELVWEEIRSIIKGAKPPVSRRRFAELAARLASAQASLHERVELAEYVVRLANLELGARLDGVRARKTAFGSLEEFAASLRDGAPLRRDEQLFLLDAAARLLERQSARLDQPLLSLREYEGLGRKRAPNFPFDRRDIHRLAEYYQERLQADARYDEIDQTRAALQYLERNGNRFRYDLVVCDEVQDFTDMQLALLFRLAGDPRRTVLTGDPKQIINPSGFRWEEVRARYYERGLPVPPVVNLSVNFRSVGNIVCLANEVLLLKRSLIGVASGEIAERWTFRGRPPLLVAGLSEAVLLDTIRRGGAGQVVLVRTEAERDRLRAALGSELVFTVVEAKGLEFDAVLLWRFPTALGSPAIWRRIGAGQVRGATDAPHVRHELSLLYVAVTRARNTLVIWDGEQVSPIWDVDALAGQVYRSAESTDIDNLWQRVSTPAEWRAQGDYFMEREHYAAAEECYRNAQAATEQEVARAHRLEREGELLAAAEVFVGLGRVPRAAEGLERAGAFDEAARIWRRAGNEMRATACDAKQQEAAGHYEAAAVLWQQLGVEEGVLRNWQRAGEYGKLAKFYLDQKVPSEAARYLQRIGDHVRAADQFRRAGMLSSAAAELEVTGDHAGAAALYRRLGDNDALLRCLLGAGAYHEAGLVYEKRGDLGRAAACFRRHAESSPEARRDLERELAGIAARHAGMRAAIRMAAVGQPAQAAPIYLSHGHPERAAELFSAVGQHRSAARCLAECGKLRDAAREVARAGAGAEDVREAVDYLVTYLHERDLETPDRVRELTRTAGRLLRGAGYEGALAHYLAVGSIRGSAYLEGTTAAYGKLERHADALEYCLRHRRGAAAADYLDARPGLVLAVSEVESLVRGPAHRPVRGTRLNSEDEGVQRVLIRLVHGCLYRGSEPDRRARVAALLSPLTGRLDVSAELIDLAVDLRGFELVVAIAASLLGALPPMDELREYLVGRIEHTADEERDAELALCAQLDDRAAFEAGLDNLEVNARNVVLFALSKRHYRVAADFLVEQGDLDQAALVCTEHEDHERAGRILGHAHPSGS